MRARSWWSILTIGIGISACNMHMASEPNNLEELDAEVHGDVLRAVIEIPAGTVEKRQYDPTTNTFPVDTRNGVPRRITFLPYPANYGFIPGTRMNKDEGGDGDAVDVFVLCGAIPTGTVLEVEPIGVIELLDAGERDDKLIAVPVDPALRTVDAGDITELPEAARDILVTWLLNYDPVDGAELVAVKGKQEALETVKRWIVR
ncbi:MAG: inorganic diphosphatase [Flavobacteriales bacterium]|nr:inorganic diphosphatase [Flavobacteriales bacterium]